MGEYEPITKELRKDFDLCTRMDGIAPYEFETVWITKSVVLATLDNIDAIHRSLEQENERLRNVSERGDDWIKLPLDADGVVIHIGDTLEWSDGTTFEVVGIGDGTLYYLDADAEGHISIEWTSTEQKRHVKPDTWESIIEDAINSVDGGPTIAALVARCKALCERTKEGDE